MPEDKVLVGKAVTLKVTVQNNYLSAKKVSLVVADKGFEGDATDFEVKPGKQTLEVPVTFQAAGLHDLRFSLTAGDDNLSQNNSFQSFLNIPVFENVLVLENQPGESADLAALLGEDFRVTVLNIHTDADRLPTSAKELCAYEQVVLVNIANSDLTGKDAPNGFDQALYDYVYRMGGSLRPSAGRTMSEPTASLPARLQPFRSVRNALPADAPGSGDRLHAAYCGHAGHRLLRFHEQRTL